MHTLIATLLPLADDVPDPEDVTFDWMALVVFVALAVAIVAIGYFLSRSLRRSRATAERGGYDPSTRDSGEGAGSESDETDDES